MGLVYDAIYWMLWVWCMMIYFWCCGDDVTGIKYYVFWMVFVWCYWYGVELCILYVVDMMVKWCLMVLFGCFTCGMVTFRHDMVSDVWCLRGVG